MTPCAANMCWASLFWTGGREAGGSKCQARGTLLGSWMKFGTQEVGRHRQPGLENQDSRHIIDEPRGSFPDFWATFSPFRAHLASFTKIVRVCMAARKAKGKAEADQKARGNAKEVRASMAAKQHLRPQLFGPRAI